MVHDRFGSGEAIILLHGVGSRRGVWSPVSDLLAAHHDVVAVDFPGFGDSPSDARADGSIEAYATCIEELIAELGIQHPHVVGNSMGGAVALELGRRGVARSVVAFAPIGFWRRPGLIWTRTAVRTMRAVSRPLRPLLPALARSRTARGLLFGTFYGRPRQLDRTRGLADVEGLVSAAGVDSALDGFGRWRLGTPGRLTEIPVTIAWGSRDVLLTYSTQARRARWLVPWARHVSLDGCGHLPFPDDPAACLAAVLETTHATGPNHSTVGTRATGVPR
ncbi:alpha/beta fold hydrolase [Streptomyces fulvoviolaceus]|uniref:alpha/beta fold hydrolase n=1 Tax=Streptomyces fulvoviolaceus TaxID=285535 RepID=UPI0007C5503D|nr:alpha/beta hydrolase [Streptomyces fulvoviolaceus]